MSLSTTYSAEQTTEHKKEIEMAISKEFQDRFIELTSGLETASKEKRAEAIGINRSTFCNAYNYGIVPKTPSLIQIADYFNISVDYLIAVTDDEYFEKSKHPKNFLERLEELRIERGIKTRYELSQEILIHRNNIAQWYKINCLPLIDDLIIIAKYFDVSIDYLLGRTDDRTPYK